MIYAELNQDRHYVSHFGRKRTCVLIFYITTKSESTFLNFIDHRVKKSFAQKLVVLEAFYANLFGIMLKTPNPLHLKPLARLPSFLHNGTVNEIPIAQEKTIFFLPSIEGNFMKLPTFYFIYRSM